MRRAAYLMAILLFLILISCKPDPAEVRSEIETYMTENEFNGIFYLKKDGAEYFKMSVSGVNSSVSLPDSTDAIHLASLTKLFTKTVILKLADQGKIDLDATICDHRPSFKSQFGREITVRQLFMMTSGLPRELNPDDLFTGVRFSNQMAGAFLDSIPDFEPAFSPGSEELYSNLNYWILGAIVEEVTGQNLEQAFNELLFTPVGMNQSGLFLDDSTPIPGFENEENQWRTNSKSFEGRYTSGGFYASLEDLIKLDNALRSDSFLTTESQDLLFNGEENSFEVYGALPGFTNMFISDRRNNLTFIALNNIGIRDLEKMFELKNLVYEQFDLGQREQESSGRRIQVNPISELNDSIPLERGMKEFIPAVESGDASDIYSVLARYSIPGSLKPDDESWQEIVEIRYRLPNFRVAGFRWVEDEIPNGIEVWFISDEEAKIGFLWIPGETNPDLFENIMIKPVDMVWLGEDY